jgi:drug/metabolite transporter (DMT)-like permease
LATRSRLLAIVEAFLAVVVWGVSFVLTKIALQYVQPITVVWLRFFLGVVVMGAAMLLRKQYSHLPDKEWLYLAGVGFIGISFHQWLQSTGMVTTQATTTAWIVATVPIFMALLGWLFLKEALNLGQLAGVAVAGFGVLMVVSRGNLDLLARGKFGTFGDLLVLISSPNWAVFSILSRRGLKQYPATFMMFWVMLFGWLFLSILFVIQKGWLDLANLPLAGWGAILGLGIFASGFAYIFWYDALQTLSAAQTGAFVYLEPFVTAIVAVLLLDERLTLPVLVGGSMILFGVWLVNRPARTRKT